MNKSTTKKSVRGTSPHPDRLVSQNIPLMFVVQHGSYNLLACQSVQTPGEADEGEYLGLMHQHHLLPLVDLACREQGTGNLPSPQI